LSAKRNVEYKGLLKEFLGMNKEVQAILLSDEEGFIIAGEKRADVDMELVSFLTAIVNPVLERMRDEFAFKQFGTASFDTDEHRLLFISINATTTLSLVIQSMGSIDRISPYAYFLAEKTAQFLGAEEDEIVNFTLPIFEYEYELTADSDRAKYLLYQDKLGLGGSYRFKFIIIGDHEVGKTSIVRRFVDERFNADYRATIGLNIIPHDFDAFGNRISLSLWDIGAQQYFKRYRKTYYNGAQAAFIVFDLTNPESFENIKVWHNELKEFIENKDMPIIIIGNKADLVEDREISPQDGLKIAKALSDLSEFSDLSEASAFVDMSELTEASEVSKAKIPYLETSAKTGQHILYAFSLISYHFMLRCKELEEEKLTKEIIGDINSIIEDVGKLTITFASEDPGWSPGLQILTELKLLGNCTKIKDKKSEKIYQYPSGLFLKNFSFDTIKAAESDCIFCLFDARDKEHIDSKWNDILNKLIKKLEKNKVISIGIRVSEDTDWSQLIEEFNVSDQAEKKMVTLLFFKFGEEYRYEIFEQLNTLLKTIKELIFAY
jgi:small GTP-binding protein